MHGDTIPPQRRRERNNIKNNFLRDEREKIRQVVRPRFYHKPGLWPKF
jgi:hypothetical protein